MMKTAQRLLPLLAGLLPLALFAQTNPPVAETNAAADSAAKPPPPLLTDAAHPAPDAKTLFTIYMIGDSLMSTKPLIPAHPERGWGQMLPQYFQSGVRIENHAINGRSTKSFLDEGRWKIVAASLRTNDWVIIQFGHNDQKDKDTNRFTQPFGQFQTNLTRFVTETRAHGASPILCTPVARRKFDAAGDVVDTHGDYSAAARQVAESEKVPLLDLDRRTGQLLRELGAERAKMLFDWFPTNEFPGLKKNLEDDTHLNAFGASRVCDLAVEEIKSAAPELARHLNPGK